MNREVYPRECRNGHTINGPEDEKTSGHRQCLQCRRDSQDAARGRHAARWWHRECGFTQEHARTLAELGEAAWHAALNELDEGGGWRLCEEHAEEAGAYEFAMFASDLQEVMVARQFPEGKLEHLHGTPEYWREVEEIADAVLEGCGGEIPACEHGFQVFVPPYWSDEGQITHLSADEVRAESAVEVAA